MDAEVESTRKWNHVYSSFTLQFILNLTTTTIKQFDSAKNLLTDPVGIKFKKKYNKQ